MIGPWVKLSNKMNDLSPRTTKTVSFLKAKIEAKELSQKKKKKFMRLHLQTNQSKMEWRCGSNRRVPALQVQSPEFKPKSNQKEKIRR
jgi:hypothetical protein